MGWHNQGSDDCPLMVQADDGVDRLKQGGYALAAERGERLPLARQVPSTVEELLGKIRAFVEEARLEPVGGSNVARRCLP
jgi:hypothetical protein